MSERINAVKGWLICMWHGCMERAAHEIHAKDGEVWAKLCDGHKAEFDAAVTSAKPGTVLSTWVKAQGGPKAAAARMLR